MRFQPWSLETEVLFLMFLYYSMILNKWVGPVSYLNSVVFILLYSSAKNVVKRKELSNIVKLKDMLKELSTSAM